MAETFEHNKVEDIADLPDHPIPVLDDLDVMAIKKQGGADLVVVIASPIDESEFSQNRLLKKLQNYFGFINSSAFQLQASVQPTPENTRVIVKLHPESSDVYIDLLNRCKSWAIENNCSVELQILTAEELK